MYLKHSGCWDEEGETTNIRCPPLATAFKSYPYEQLLSRTTDGAIMRIVRSISEKLAHIGFRASRATH
jgi:hypothetical protein